MKKYIYKNTGMIVESDMMLDSSIFEPLIENYEADQDSDDDVPKETVSDQDSGDSISEASSIDPCPKDGILEDPTADQNPEKTKTTRKTTKKAAI